MDTFSFVFGFISGAFFISALLAALLYRAVKPYMKSSRAVRQAAGLSSADDEEAPASFIFLPDSLLGQLRKSRDLRPLDKWPPDELDTEE